MSYTMSAYSEVGVQDSIVQGLGQVFDRLNTAAKDQLHHHDDRLCIPPSASRFPLLAFLTLAAAARTPLPRVLELHYRSSKFTAASRRTLRKLKLYGRSSSEHTSATSSRLPQAE